MLNTLKNPQKTISPNPLNKREVSDVADKIAKDWFEAAINRNNPKPSSVPQNEKNSLPQPVDSKKTEEE